MLIKRRKARPSFGSDGRKVGGTTTMGSGVYSSSSASASASALCLPTNGHSSNRLFSSDRKFTVQRAPLLTGLSCSGGLFKKFQRPKQTRRVHQKAADAALQVSSLGMKKRTNGMQGILARQGKPLEFVRPKQLQDENGDTASSSGSEAEDEEEDRPFDPLRVWSSPHTEGVEPKGLPTRLVEEVQSDEFGIEMTVKTRRPAPLTAYSKNDVYVPPVLAKWLRPHQREGTQFMYECVMGMREFSGAGCILADDMGLGKTLQSVSLIYTLLKTTITSRGEPTAKRIIVVCPCSLVKNWDNEFVKWLGPGGVKTLAIAEGDRKKVESDLDSFVKTKLFQILICSYECLRTHVKRLTKYKDCCDLLVCDEAHRLKNNENQTSRALNSLPVQRRVLLTGTPMQNDLQEFYAMVDFTNPGVMGTQEEFRRNTLLPILRGREPDASESQRTKMMKIQEEMSRTVNEFILRRINTLNAEHLPPKLVQVVCCNLTEVQQNMYQHLIASKDLQHVMDGKQVNCLGSIQMLMKLCNHPSLVAEDDQTYGKQQKGGRRAATKQVKYTDEDETNSAAPGADGIAKFLPYASGGGGRGNMAPIHPEWSGKMFCLWRLMKEMRKPGNGNDKIVIISNYTQTLDLIGRMCRESTWGFCRLDGSINMKKRQKMVDEFNDPSSSMVAFLLSSKAGGCGLNLIGGNRLVLFDPDWNPAVDKQAAARCWRDGQRKRCFTYRFLATGTVEEKIFQRQLSKEGLQSVVDDKQQVNELSTKDLRNLFKLRNGTPSDTHDKLRCERCQIIQDNAEMEAMKVLPLQLAACLELVDHMMEHEDAKFFHKPLVSQDHGIPKEAYEKVVKQLMDLGTIQTRLKMTEEQASSYKNISSVSKDVNRIFSNVMKVWAPGDEIADAARRLQSWWIEQWTVTVPRLMSMKAEDETKKEEGDPSVDILEGCSQLNNERGDDYQEQIGMPDEENMRQWSHHHTTDTVDDPVFRAAMRGSDVVSFVFGLEVTWSLIQQRQQDEDDKKAMEAIEEVGEEELEAVAAMGGARNVEPKEENAENESSSVEEEGEGQVMDSEAADGHEDRNTESRGGEDQVMDVEEDDDDDEVLSDDSSEAVDLADSSEEEQSVASASASASASSGVAEDKTPEGEIMDTSQSQDVSVVEVVPASQATSSSGTSSTPSPAKNEWQCPTCTLFNKRSLRKCQACNTKKPKAGAKRSIEEIDE